MDSNVYDLDRIMKRYDIKKEKAYRIMRRIAEVNGGLTLGKGRILLSEIEYFENTRGGKDIYE